MIGYRFSVDDADNVYIIKLYAPIEIEDKAKRLGTREYYSKNGCICLSITNANTGEEVENALLQGVRKTFVQYEKDKEIPGCCWYCASVEDLLHSYLHRDEDTGLIRYGGGDLYKQMDNYILYTADVHFHEVAEEMHITTDELIEKLNYLKKTKFTSLEEKEAAGKPILDATGAVTTRKIKNGELLPGWKRHLIMMGIDPDRAGRSLTGG